MIIIETEELKLLNKCAKAIQLLLQLPNKGSSFPSFGDMEIYYDISMDIGIFPENKELKISLRYKTEDDEGYSDYVLEPDENGNFEQSIYIAVAKHNKGE